MIGSAIIIIIMVSFLFWNLNKKPLHNVLARIVQQYEIDIIILAEFNIAISSMLTALNTDPTNQFHYSPSIGCTKISIFSKFSPNFLPPIYEEDRITIRHLTLPGLTDIILAAVHLPSKLYWNDNSQAAECREIARSIAMVENQLSHERSVLVGDMNMNPFEDGLIQANGFHAVMSKNIASKKSRVVQGRNYSFFYNPMWNLMGDATPGPPGTFFYDNSSHNVYFWNMFDQVVIRPDIIPYFSNNDLQVISSVGNTSLLSKNGYPDKRIMSDHLPIVFRLLL